MPEPIRINTRQLHELEQIRDLGPRKLNDILLSLRRAKEPILTLRALRRAMDAIAGEDGARIISQQLFALNAYRRKTGAEIDEVIDSLNLGIENSEWNTKEKESWSEVKHLLKEILELDSINTATKAADLTYDYTNLLESARILTDIRPVFDERRKEVAAAIVSQTLRITYVSEDGTHSISVSMDHADVERLSDACDNAIQKARIAKNLMATKCGLQSVIPGDESE